MPQTRKIATCCYCGTRAVLVLDKGRHELACAACGAPLHVMKAMPVAAPVSKPVHRVAPVRPTRPERCRKPEQQARYLPGKKRKRRGKRLSRKIFEELWDVVEDIFD